jgi:hypothetical protein
MITTDDSLVSGDNGGVPKDAPEEVKALAAKANGQPREPKFDATLGVALTFEWKGKPRNRIVVIGDSLSHGFQSGAIFNTDLSYGAIIAYELGCLDSFRYPRYGGRGGLPLNIELLLRDLEKHLGSTVSFWELPQALFDARDFMDHVEDYWERGTGSVLPPPTEKINHALAVYGWDLRDALDWTATELEQALHKPKDDLLTQIVENNNERAALRVYPRADADKGLTLFGAAKKLGDDTKPVPGKAPDPVVADPDLDYGIETLIVFLGANNALQSVTDLKVNWSGPGYDSLKGKGAYTVWRPEHFRGELAKTVAAVRAIKARHVIWCTVPHVTIVPIARGVGDKIRTGSRYYPFYTRPWIEDKDFSASQDEHITGAEARAVDYAIDLYNADIEKAVLAERTKKTPSDWLLLDIAGLLDRLAARRYINDPNARPDWWTPYPLPAALKALQPEPDSRFLTGDGKGGRASGGLFALDGVHPTTVAYGLIAQEMINIMQQAGVKFQHRNGTERHGPVEVDFDRLIMRDTLVRFPPQILRSGLKILGWADERLDWVRRTLTFRS